MKISMKLVYQYTAIFFNFSPTSNHLHPLQQLADANGKFRLERVNPYLAKQSFQSVYMRLNHCYWERNVCSNITICNLSKTYMIIVSADYQLRQSRPKNESLVLNKYFVLVYHT